MAERTSTYLNFEGNVQDLIGADTLLSTEKTAINGYFRRWVRKGWNRANWPEICRIEQRTPASSVVEYEQSGEEAIGELLNIFRAYPYSNTFPYEVAYTLDYRGAVLLGATSLGTVYVHYRQRIPDYSGYDGTDTGTDIVDETFPYRFLNYAVYGSYSDWLASEGQHEKSRLTRQQAEETILDELDILERQQRQQTATIFSTHNSSQWR